MQRSRELNRASTFVQRIAPGETLASLTPLDPGEQVVRERGKFFTSIWPGDVDREEIDVREISNMRV